MQPNQTDTKTVQQTEGGGTVASSALLGFGDALLIARGCHDYSGGHHTDGHYDAYHHGIQTVINVLEAAEKAGLNDTQVAAVWCIGGEKPNAAGELRPPPANQK